MVGPKFHIMTQGKMDRDSSVLTTDIHEAFSLSFRRQSGRKGSKRGDLTIECLSLERKCLLHINTPLLHGSETTAEEDNGR